MVLVPSATALLTVFYVKYESVRKYTGNIFLSLEVFKEYVLDLILEAKVQGIAHTKKP